MMQRLITIVLTLSTTVSSFGLLPMETNTRGTVATTTTTTTRSNFIQSIIGTVSTAAVVAVTGTTVMKPQLVYAKDGDSVTLPNGVIYTVLKEGKGPKPERGELVAIRFAAYNGEVQIDNVLDTPEPYYTRVGSGGLIPGVEQTLPLMQLGDRWKMTIPVRPYFSLV
jgi:FKBP-type peptidyl-prolyl cis-trans isomerase